MNQEYLAHAFNVSFATINRWKNGEIYPNKMAIDEVYAFCEKDGIDINNFRNTEGIEEDE